MDHNEQRDYAEESANRTAMEREGISELQDEALDATRSRDVREIAETHVSTSRPTINHRSVYGTKRVSFTAMSADGIFEILGRMEESGKPYPMELNHSDFWNFLIALRHLHDDSTTHPELQEWAASFISSIGETFNVEMV